MPPRNLGGGINLWTSTKEDDGDNVEELCCSDRSPSIVHKMISSYRTCDFEARKMADFKGNFLCKSIR